MPRVRFFLLLSFLLLVAMPKAYAKATSRAAAPDLVFVVNATQDMRDLEPGDGQCAAFFLFGFPHCTLRAAVMEANASPGDVEIRLPQAEYILSIHGNDGCTIVLGATICSPTPLIGDLDLIKESGSITIKGDKATIRNDTNSNLIEVLPDTVAIIEGVTIGENGAIYNDGHLTMRGITAENVSPYIVSHGTLIVDDLTVDIRSGSLAIVLSSDGSNGISTAQLKNVHIAIPGKAIHVFGKDVQVTMEDVTLDNNSQAMTIRGHGHQVEIRNSTISNNGPEGGISVQPDDGGDTIEVNIVNSTLSGNEGGSALSISSDDADAVQVTLNNVTITDNQGEGQAGGVSVVSSGGQPALSMANSIVAGNSASGSSGKDCSGAFLSLGHNLLGSLSGCTVSGDTAANIVNPDPKLAPLADNGGGTKTHALLAGSPAFNSGSPDAPGSGGGACAVEDQRGSDRPRDGRCDMGAVETDSSDFPPPAISSLNPSKVVAPGGDLVLTINGQDFTTDAVVRWGSQERTTTFANSSKIFASIRARDVLVGGTFDVSVFDTKTGLTSNSQTFTVENPVPVLTSISPVAVREDSSTQLVVRGSNFNRSSVVLVNNSSRPTTFISSSELSVFVPSSFTGNAGNNIGIRVRNPGPGGGTSNTLILTVFRGFIVGEGSVESNIPYTPGPALLTLQWIHPTNWRELEKMELRLVDDYGQAVLWLGFVEALGDKGGIVLYTEDGALAGQGFPGDEVMLRSGSGLLDLAQSQILAAPGTTVSVDFAVQFDPAVRGKSYRVQMSADDDDGNGQGFEDVGTVTIPVYHYLPMAVDGTATYP